jgi:HSP20 family protein
MAEVVGKVPVRTESKGAPAVSGRGWYPFENLRREIDRLFEDFDSGFWGGAAKRSLFEFAPFGRLQAVANVPAVDIVQKDGGYEITVELPGIDEKSVDVTLADGGLTIKAEKKDEKKEEKKDYYLSERRYGAFERYFAIPEGVDTGRISANFRNGVLTVALPKSADAQKQEKKILVKAA